MSKNWSILRGLNIYIQISSGETKIKDQTQTNSIQYVSLVKLLLIHQSPNFQGSSSIGLEILNSLFFNQSQSNTEVKWSGWVVRFPNGLESQSGEQTPAPERVISLQRHPALFVYIQLVFLSIVISRCKRRIGKC